MKNKFNSEEYSDFVGSTLIITDNNFYMEFPLWRQHFDPANRG